MSLLRAWIKRTFSAQTPHHTRPKRWKPSLEYLEDRITPSIYTVTDLTDNASDTGSIRYAVNHVNADATSAADTIDLTGVSGTIKLTGGVLDLTRTAGSVSITGPGASQLTVSGNMASAVFQNSSNTFISGLTIASGSNGGMSNSSSLTISDCAFTNNTTTGIGGGFNNSGNTTVSNCTFSGNTGTGGSSDGGGIFNSGYLAVDGSTFTNNSVSAGFGGGAIFNGGTLEISGSSFGTNSAGYGGGGIWNNSGTLTITGTSFTGNSCSASAAGGGGIYNFGGTMTVNDSAFTSNNGDNGSGNSEGGGIFNGSTGTITNSVFTTNTCGYGGGGVYNDSALTISGSMFINNNVPNNIAGGIYNEGTLTLQGSTLSGNSASFGGGGIWSDNGTLTVASSTFTGNGAGYGGGGIWNDSGTLTVAGSTFTGNSAGSTGGGIDVNAGTGSLLSTIVAGNVITGSSTASDADGTLSTAKSAYNLIGTGDSAGLTNGSNHNQVGVSNPDLSAVGYYGGPAQTIALFAGSPALTAGTAVQTTLSGSLAAGSNSFSVSDPTFLGVGEVIGVDSEQMQITAISGSTITVTRGYNNTADSAHNSGANVILPTDQRGFPSIVNTFTDVGAFETQASPLTVTTLADPGQMAGQLSLREAINLVNADPSSQTDTINFASGLSGTIVLNAGALSLSRSSGPTVITGPGSTHLTISGNNTTQVFAVNFVTASISGLTIANGVNSSGLGGGLFNFGTLTVSGCAFNNDSAGLGGGLANDGTLTVINTSFTGDFGIGGSSDGGGLDNEGPATISGSTFANDSVSPGFGGGGIYNNSTLSITDSTIADNTAGFGGGGIWNDAGTLTIANSTITGNSAPNGGGGIDVNGGTAALLSTIVVGNVSAGTTASDITGSLSTTESAYNLVGTGGSGGLTTGINHNKVGISVASAALSTLGSYGGPTQTVTLNSDSAASAAGSAVQTTLSAPLAAGSTNTTLTVNDATFLAAGEVIAIGSEQMQITIVSGTSVTVVRGYNGTTAAAHPMGANIVLPTDQRQVARTVSGSTDIGATQAQTTNITITNALVVDQNDNPVSTIHVGDWVFIQVDFNTFNMPGNASYRADIEVNGVTLNTIYINWGAGDTGTDSWNLYWGTFQAAMGTNQVIVTIDPDHAVAETSYTDNVMSFTFNAVTPVSAGYVTTSVAQMRNAYGVNSIPNFGAAAADGTGQTVTLVDADNEPTILSDLDGFDKAMSLTTTSTMNMYQQYGPASSFVNVFNQYGQNITSEIADSGANGVPPEDPSGHWEGEETLDVEWAHAMAPGAKIDIIEANNDDNWPTNLLLANQLAAGLPGVSSISNSWGLDEWSGETVYDSSVFDTPAGHSGVTFLTASNDNGAGVYDGNPSQTAGNNGYYPATSPNVLSVGGTTLTLNNDGYGSETGWSYPAPANTVNHGGSAYSQTGAWVSHPGGFSGTYGTAAAAASSTATWTVPVTPNNTGWGTELSATWIAAAGNATNATYTIYDGTAATGTKLGTVAINQKVAPAGTADGSFQFQELGVFFPTLDGNGDGTLTVVLNAQSANGTVVADAIGASQAWASTGGPTAFETEPSYQTGFESTGQRVTPDVALDASQFSGATTYFQGGLGYDGFGTSLSSPAWAGLIAVANQGRVAAGGTPLDSHANPTQTLQAIYSLPAGDFNDITTGYNGYSAGTGYDFVTGRGTPIASLLIPDLASYALTPTVTGISPSSGPTTGGESVTITGTNFIGATLVKFGATSATSFTVVSSTRIVAVEPAESAGTVDVQVTTPGGTTAKTAADKFTFAVAVSSVAVDGSTAPILSASVSGGVVTITTDGPSGFAAGQHVLIAGLNGNGTLAGFNGAWSIATASGNTFTYSDASATGSFTANASGNNGTATTNGSLGLLSNGATSFNSQRSMVDSVVYTFNQPVNLGANAITITATGQGGVVPTVAYASPDGGVTWVITFSGGSVEGNSIANGEYQIVLNASAVTAVSGGSALPASNTQTFYRLFGDTGGNGHQRVNTTDTNAFLGTFNTRSTQAAFLAYLDFNDDGRINTTETNAFLGDFNLRYSGFTATI